MLKKTKGFLFIPKTRRLFWVAVFAVNCPCFFEENNQNLPQIVSTIALSCCLTLKNDGTDVKCAG